MNASPEELGDGAGQPHVVIREVLKRSLQIKLLEYGLLRIFFTDMFLFLSFISLFLTISEIRRTRKLSTNNSKLLVEAEMSRTGQEFKKTGYAYLDHRG